MEAESCDGLKWSGSKFALRLEVKVLKEEKTQSTFFKA